jgi:hypothetical protein
MLVFHVVLAVTAVILMAMIYIISRRIINALAARGYLIPNSMPAIMALMFGLAINGRMFAQSTLDIDIDLSNFWTGFNEFFGALFPPLAFIASISAALGFIFLIINALKGAFSGSRG